MVSPLISEALFVTTISLGIEAMKVFRVGASLCAFWQRFSAQFILSQIIILNLMRYFIRTSKFPCHHKLGHFTVYPSNATS
jgi:hypothetical protein